MDMTNGAHIGARHLMCGACGGGLMVNPNAYMSGHHHAMMQFKRSGKGFNMNQIQLGDIGVCLSNYDDTGAMYQVIGWGLHDEIKIKRINDDAITYVPQSDFWSLI